MLSARCSIKMIPHPERYELFSIETNANQKISVTGEIFKCSNLRLMKVQIRRERERERERKFFRSFKYINIHIKVEQILLTATS